MDTFSIHEAKSHLSRLVERAANGEPFKIAKAGKAMVMVVALGVQMPTKIRRLGFMAGQIEVPDDFDRMGDSEIVKRIGH